MCQFAKKIKLIVVLKVHWILALFFFIMFKNDEISTSLEHIFDSTCVHFLAFNHEEKPETTVKEISSAIGKKISDK
jgi:hypothetical protein